MTKLLVRCNRDGFERIGTPLELQDLVQLGGCKSCNGYQFKCPKCGYVVNGRKIEMGQANTSDKGIASRTDI